MKHQIYLEEQPKRRMMVPQTQAQYLEEQSVVREVFDPESGRTRFFLKKYFIIITI